MLQEKNTQLAHPPAMNLKKLEFNICGTFSVENNEKHSNGQQIAFLIGYVKPC